MHFLIGVTGHRKLAHPREDVRDSLIAALKKIKPLYVISGMAVGFDQLVAEACLELGIKYIAAVPFEGQESVWPSAAREHYWELLERAWFIHYVNEGKI